MGSDPTPFCFILQASEKGNKNTTIKQILPTSAAPDLCRCDLDRRDLARSALGHPDGRPALGCPVFVLPVPVPPRPRPLDLGRPVVTRLPRPRPPSSCRRQGQRRCQRQRQNKKNKTIRKILPSFTRNSGPVAGNDDGGETGKERGKEEEEEAEITRMLLNKLTLFQLMGGGTGRARRVCPGPGEDDIMVDTWLSLGFAVVGGRVTVWCRDTRILANFGQFSVIFGQKLAVFIIFDKEKRSNFFGIIVRRALARRALRTMVFGGKRTNRGRQLKSPRFLQVFLPYKPTFLHFLTAV